MSLEETSAMYAEVKAWIASQEAFEKATKTPAPLTNAQRKALEVLRLPLSVTPPPELGNVDYISLLNSEYERESDGEGRVELRQGNMNADRSYRVPAGESHGPRARLGREGGIYQGRGRRHREDLFCHHH